MRILRIAGIRGFVSKSWSEGVDNTLYLMGDVHDRATWKNVRSDPDTSTSWRHQTRYSTMSSNWGQFDHGGQPYSIYDFEEPKDVVVMPPSDFQIGPYLVTDEGLDPVEYVNADEL